MAGQMAMAKVNVSGSDGSNHREVSILVRGNRAVLRKGRDLIAEVDGVTAVQRQTSKRWTVELADGVVWTVDKVPCKPCTGAR